MTTAAAAAATANAMTGVATAVTLAATAAAVSAGDGTAALSEALVSLSALLPPCCLPASAEVMLESQLQKEALELKGNRPLAKGHRSCSVTATCRRGAV